ncbi:hypothetical protein H2200_003769 [Cladophialophora chaetospira]|uniref:Uncharacterized protein n=1 Tax=Cladophialophora chaetospira TaxID=386627 RepID=A0AA39CL19_9EURO|nr:hypothetical protein H2200_003769 [Cladophialophora chaetospira]
MSSTSPEYQTVLESLLPPACPHHVLSLPVLPRKPHIPAQTICNLSLHPVLESALHILNMDLPSAHFLLRHMQAAPASEAMYLHGLLHRIEGDLDNCRAWYGDVKDTEAFRWVWGGMDAEGAESADGQSESPTASADESHSRALAFLDKVEAYKNSLLSSKRSLKDGASKTSIPSEDELGEISLREIRRMLSFCDKKFGTTSVADASKIWVSMNEKHADKAAEMITGGEGWREF